MNINVFLSGGNYATESILPTAWGYNAMDSRNLKAIHKEYGESSLKKYPLMSFYDYYMYYPFIHKLKTIRPLNYLPYKREEAITLLKRELGWKNYGDKHHESRWTKWFQSYYLPTRFGYDKRRAHLSSMILSGEIKREEALKQLEIASYDENERRIDEEFIIKKLNMTKNEFETCFKNPPRHYSEFANYEFLYKAKNHVKTYASFIKRVFN